MQTTSIEWTEMSVNPILARDGEGHTGHYCEKISPGCKNCYASKLQRRFRMPEFQNASLRDGIQPFLDEAKLMEVLRRKKPTKIFWCDMSDLFGEWVPDEWIDKCFAVMALTPQHTHQILTKRAGRMRAYFSNNAREYRMRDVFYDWSDGDIKSPFYIAKCAAGNQRSKTTLKNVWLGVSCENQAAADERIPLLLQTPAAVRFVSAEPLIGPIDFRHYLSHFWNTPAAPFIHTLDQIIIGGESGKDARPMNIQWARDIIAQCKEARVPVFMKQLGSNPTFSRVDTFYNTPHGKGEYPQEWPLDLRVQQWPEVKG